MSLCECVCVLHLLCLCKTVILNLLFPTLQHHARQIETKGIKFTEKYKTKNSKLAQLF